MTLLWLRAPLLLWRRPGVAAALFFAALVAIAPAAAYPMLVSSASAAALHTRAAGACPWVAGSQFTGVLDSSAGHLASIPLKARTDVEAKAFAGLPHVSTEQVVTVFRDGLRMDTPHGAEASATRLATRTGFADHVKVLSGPSGDGLWVPSRIATKAQLKVGDPVSLGDFHSTVAAVYADLRDNPMDPSYWCSSSTLYTGRPGEGDSRPIPDLVLAPQATVLAAESILGTEEGATNGVMIERTVDVTGASQQQAARIAGGVARAQAKALGEMPFTSDYDPYYPNRMRSDLVSFSARSALVGRSVAPVAAALSVAGSAVGLLALAAATSFWVRRRRRELLVLATHGVGGLALGGKGVLEALPAVLLGGAVGGVGAWLAIRDGGPNPLLDPSAVQRGVLTAAAVLAGCLVVILATAAAGARALLDRSPRRRQGSRLRHVPWELAVIAVAAALWTPLGDAHLQTLEGDQAYGSVASIPLRLFVTPPLIVLGALILLVRLAAWRLSRPPTEGARQATRGRGRRARASSGPVLGGPAGNDPAVGDLEPVGERQWQTAGPSWVTEGARGSSRSAVAPAWVGDSARGSSRGSVTAPARQDFDDRAATSGSARASAKPPRKRGPVGLLVWRRLGRDAVAAAILAVATGTPVGLAVFGATVGQTASSTLVAQAQLQNGADVVIHLSEPAAVPASLRDQATPVRRADHVELGDTTVSVLEIDPTTFARGAYWDDRLGGGSLHDLVTGISPTQAVAAYPASAGDESMRSAAGPSLSFHVRAVPLLPASQGGYPTVLGPPGVLDRLEVSHISDTMLWVRGDPADIHRKALAAHLPVTEFTDATSLYQHTWIEPVTYTFTYTIAIATLMGLITTVGLVLYLEAGMPARKRAWVMLRRMGMRPGGHWRSLLAQIAVPVVFGAVLGAAFATVAAVLTRADMDVDNLQPPNALLAVPLGALLVVGLVVVVVVAGTVLTTHLRTVRAHPSVVLRDVG